MLILTMSLSGSAVLLTILLCTVLGKGVFPSAWSYNMLKLDLLFFCLPLPKYNSGFKNGLSHLLGIRRQCDMANITIENFIGIEGSGRLHINVQTYIMVMWAVWLCGLLLAAAKNLRKLHAVKAVKENPRVNQSNYLAIFDRVKEEVGVKKGVTLLCADEIEMICTIGIFPKYILIPESGLTEEEIYYSLKHELIHIKRSDVAWRYLSLFVVFLHWFNPFAYLYFYAMSVYCEQSCDAILVQNMNRAERKRYGELIIDMAQDHGSGKWKYRTNLSGSKEMIQRRLINMLKSGKRSRLQKAASLLVGAVILFGGSLTVCAYEGPQVVRGEADLVRVLSNEENEKIFVVEEINYSEEEALDYRMFIGDDGTSYSLPERTGGSMERAGCFHSFVSGYIKDHHKYSDGSCKTDYYFAEMCSICREVRSKGYSHTETSTKCTH